MEARFELDRTAWDYYGAAQTRLLELVRKEKDQRRHELFLINTRQAKLEEWERRLEQRESNVIVRESRILVYEPYLWLAKQLAEKNIAVEDISPFVDVIKEKATAEKISHKVAATEIAQELKIYHELVSVKQQIKRAQQELAGLMLMNFNVQQQNGNLNVQPNGYQGNNQNNGLQPPTKPINSDSSNMLQPLSMQDYLRLRLLQH